MSFDNSTVVESKPMIPNIKIDDCRLVAVEAGQITKDGVVTNKYIDFKFTKTDPSDKSVSYINDRIFEPIDRTATPPFKDYTFQAEVNRTLGRVKHILGRYIEPLAVDAVKGDTWDLYTTAVINAMPAGYKEIPCSLSVSYHFNKSDSKNYPGLRKNPSFISTVKYPKEFVEKLASGESWKGNTQGAAPTNAPENMATTADNEI